MVGIRDEVTAYDFDCCVMYKSLEYRSGEKELSPEDELDSLKLQFAAAGLETFERGE